MLSLTSIQKYLPKITAKLSLGADKFPFRLSVQHDFSSRMYNPFWESTQQGPVPKSFHGHGSCHRGELCIGLSTNADFELKVTSTRTLSRFCTLSLGIQHISSKGLTWLIRVTRGETSFAVPILLTLESSANYWVKALYVSLWTILVDMSLHDWIHIGDDVPKIIDPTFSCLLEGTKNREQAMKEQLLMVKSAAYKRQIEISTDHGGLVILNAIYEDIEGDALDVTTALQSWVVDSHLTLNAGSKKALLGFYDVRPLYRKRTLSGERSWWRQFQQVVKLILPPSYLTDSGIACKKDGPNLTVRYRTSAGVFEMSIRDDSALHLPTTDALRLGGIHVQ